MGLYNLYPTDTKIKDPKKVSGTFYTKKQRAWREKAKLINGKIMTKYQPTSMQPILKPDEPNKEDFIHA